MSTLVRYIFISVLVFSVYHLVRDIVQIIGIRSVFTDFFHWPHVWCSVYCDYMTVPFEAGAIVGSIIVLKRNRVGLIGMLSFLFLPLLFIFTVLP